MRRAGDVRGIPSTFCMGAIVAIPVTAYEMTLAIWLIVKGFNSSVVDSSTNLK